MLVYGHNSWCPIADLEPIIYQEVAPMIIIIRGRFNKGGGNVDSIGERIKQIRKLAELNQVAYAQAIGISQGTLSELESNKISPSGRNPHITAPKIWCGLKLDYPREEVIDSN